jgi:DNA-binding SARP family transcriptional activator/RecA/RadA recombinase
VTLDITLAGGCSVTTPRGVLPAAALGGPSAAVVLARLAITAGTPVSRDALADALWDGRPPRSWQPALRNVIARLRAGLPAEMALATLGDGYRLDVPVGTTIDVDTLEPAAIRAEAAAAAGDPSTALEIATAALDATSGTALPGIRGEWVDGLRTEIARRRERLARVAGEASLALGDHARAERFARALVDDLPLREDGYRLLMRALNAADNPAEALAVYDDFRLRLEDELGTVPSATTQTLFLGILRQERGAPRTTAAAGRLLLVDRQTPFVGRAALLDHLSEALDAARAAGPRVVAVAGEAGLGKTRLAAALAARAHDAGVTVAYGRADDRIAIPYGPFLEAIDGYFSGLGGAETTDLLDRHAGVLSRLVPSIAAVAPPDEAPDDPDLNQLRLVAALEHALRAIAGTDGCLLVLDDMQWASRPAIALVEHLAASTGPTALLVIVLDRGGDSPSGPGVERIELEPLTVDDVAALARLNGGDECSATRVWRDSGGNALLASELLAAGPTAPAQPARIDELVRERLASLPRDAVDVLRTAAIAGLEFDPHMVAVASVAEPTVATAALDRAREARLLVEAVEHPGWLAFRHGLVRASLLDGIDPDLRRRLHQRLAVAFETEPGSWASHARLAYHFGAAAPLGDWRAALRYGLPVARAAFEAGAHEDAAAVAVPTLDALAGAGDPDPPARLDLEILLGAAQRALGDPRGHDTLATAFAGAAELGDATRMADAALGFSHGGAATEEAFVDDFVLPMYEASLAAIGSTDHARRARLLGHVATGYAWTRDGERAARAREDAHSLAVTLSDETTLARVLTSVRRSLAGTMRIDEQWAVEESLLELAERHQDPRGRARTLLWRFETSLQRGEGDGLEGLLDEAGAIVAGLSEPAYHHSHAYYRASLEFIRGDIEAAERSIEEAADVGRRHGLADPIVESIRLGQLLGVRYEQGRLAEFRGEVTPFFAAAQLPALLGALAWIDAELGDLGLVAPNLDAFFDDFAAGGVRFIMPVSALAQVALPVAAVGDTARAQLLYDVLLPHAHHGAVLSIQAGTDWSLGLLAGALGREDDAQRHFADGVAYSERLGAPRWRERCALTRALPAGGA